MLLALGEGCQGCGTHGRTATENPSDAVQPRSIMPRFSLASPGVVMFYDVETAATDDAYYGISTVGRSHRLVTTEYYEAGRERSEIDTFTPSKWGVEIPAGAELFTITGGSIPERTRQFWVGWLLGKRVYMQALMQDGPIETELAGDETLIFPASMDNTGVAALYSWRPASEGTALWRRLFAGQIKTKPTVTTETLTAIAGRPLVSVLGAIPGDRTQHALIGWAEDTVAGAVLGIAIVRPGGIRVLRSDPVPDFSPFGHQRPGIWASAPPANERYELTVELQSRRAPHEYKTIQFSVGATQEESRSSFTNIGLPGDSLHAVAFDYVKNHVDALVNQTYLTKDGRLWLGPPALLRREHVSLDDPLAVLTTEARAYWGVRTIDGSLKFAPF